MIDRRSTMARLVQVELPVLAIVLFAIGPYIWMVLTSLKSEADIAAFPVRYLPTEVTLQHYKMLLERTSFSGNLLNSFIVAAGAVAAWPVCEHPRRLCLFALPFFWPQGADDAVSCHQHVPDCADHHSAVCADAAAWPA